MHDTATRWLVVVLIAALAVGLLLWARGAEHHRGQYVGSTSQVSLLTGTVRG